VQSKQSPNRRKFTQSAHLKFGHRVFITERASEPGWPDWAKFRPTGDCLLEAVFKKVTDVDQIFWATFFPKYSTCINFDQKWAGLHFGRFFQTHLVTLLWILRPGKVSLNAASTEVWSWSQRFPRNRSRTGLPDATYILLPKPTILVYFERSWK
jgi:hypothetical protein